MRLIDVMESYVRLDAASEAEAGYQLPAMSDTGRKMKSETHKRRLTVVIYIAHGLYAKGLGVRWSALCL